MTLTWVRDKDYAQLYRYYKEGYPLGKNRNLFNLFPNICHIHYRKIAAIVRETARECKLPYHVQPSFIRAVQNHGRMLKRLGRQ